jgi:hypothetical protein
MPLERPDGPALRALCACRSLAGPGAATGPGRCVTLLDLVTRATPLFASEAETVAGVAALLRSGRARLGGSFRGVPLDRLLG